MNESAPLRYHPAQDAIAYRDGVAFRASLVIRRRLKGRVYKQVPDTEVLTLTRPYLLIKDAVKLEKRLNAGLLAHEAEAAWPRLGLHDRPIYKVSILGRLGGAAVW